MFRLHREGFPFLWYLFGFVALSAFAVYYFLDGLIMHQVILGSLLYHLLYFSVQFFRNPNRTVSQTDDFKVLAPADGKIVVIEEVEEPEFFGDRRIQVSIFMSPFNVHVNRHPIGGKIVFSKYHPGLFLMAWNPKSSTENERTTVVYENRGRKILVRQIAGFLARRILCYVKEGETVKQGDELGFIRFGSRVDLFLPLDARINVQLDEVVTGNRTVLAELRP
jgi:phosphatidylserine decarboxylase